MARNLSEIIDLSADLADRYKERNELNKKIEHMVFMEESGVDKMTNKDGSVKITKSPDPSNQFKSSVQLLSSAIPRFHVPNAEKYGGNESKIEKFINALWREMNNLYGASLLYDMIYSAQMYGEVHFAITDMQDYLSYYKRKGSSYERRARRAARRSPFLGEVYNPRECYADFDKLGLTSHYRKVTTTAKVIAGEYGDAGIKAIGDNLDNDEIIYHEWWDLDYHAIWLDDGKEILFAEHGLPFIPIEVAITDGSLHLFKETKYQRQPFLYNVAKSELWERQNLSLSALYTLIFETGFSPVFAYQRNQQGKSIDLDFSGPFTVVNLEQGESFTALGKHIIDPSIQLGMNIANDLVEDSTIYRVARGQTIGANAAYSTHALLSQSGRLPLVTPTKRLEWLLGTTMEKCIEQLATTRSNGKREKSEIEGLIEDVDLPEDTVVEVMLEVRMPQDNLQAANIATALNATGTVSKEWIAGNILQIEQPEAMRKEIAKENVIQLLIQQQTERMLAEQQMQAQANMQRQQQMMQAQMPPAPQEAMMGDELGIPPGMPPGMPPGELPLALMEEM